MPIAVMDCPLDYYLTPIRLGGCNPVKTVCARKARIGSYQTIQLLDEGLEVVRRAV